MVRTPGTASTENWSSGQGLRSAYARRGSSGDVYTGFLFRGRARFGRKSNDRNFETIHNGKACHRARLIGRTLVAGRLEDLVDDRLDDRGRCSTNRARAAATGEHRSKS